MESRRFKVAVAGAGRDSLLVPVPFDPDEVWGGKRRHHVAGTVNGVRVRAVIEPVGDGFGFYRRGYLRWIDATKRRPEERPVRVAEMVRLLESGIKQRLR